MNGREGSLGESYDDSHRAFLQSILARGSLTLKEGQQLLAAILSVKEGWCRVWKIYFEIK